MSQPQPRPGSASRILHRWNQAERLAQADRVISRETKQHPPQGERPKGAIPNSPGKRAGEPKKTV